MEWHVLLVIRGMKLGQFAGQTIIQSESRYGHCRHLLTLKIGFALTCRILEALVRGTGSALPPSLQS